MKCNILTETTGLSHEEWLRWRQKGIGGSDVSAVLGINPWKSPIELWLEKSGQATDLPVDNESMEWGRILEPVIRRHFEEVTGKTVVELPAILQHPKNKFMLADLDGVTVDENGDPAIFEAKTAHEFKRAEWEDAVPLYYQTQVQHYLAVSGLKTAYVAVLIGGNSFRIYEIDSDKEVQDMLIRVESEFWNKVRTKTRPEIDGSDASSNMLDTLFKGGNQDDLTLDTEAERFIEEYILAASEEDQAKKKKQEAGNHLKELMGDYERAVCGSHIVSWVSVSTDRLDTKALKESEPDIYSKYVKNSVSRRFSIK